MSGVPVFRAAAAMSCDIQFASDGGNDFTHKRDCKCTCIMGYREVVGCYRIADKLQ